MESADEGEDHDGADPWAQGNLHSSHHSLQIMAEIPRLLSHCLPIAQMWLDAPVSPPEKQLQKLLCPCQVGTDVLLPPGMQASHSVFLEVSMETINSADTRDTVASSPHIWLLGCKASPSCVNFPTNSFLHLLCPDYGPCFKRVARDKGRV
jgi:hypothetical protein